MMHPEREKAQEAYLNLCTHLGHAISCWSDVESRLSMAFAAAMGAIDFPATCEALYAVSSFDAKLKLTDSIFRSMARGHPTLPAAWANIFNRLSKRSKTRNKLAHGKVVSHITGSRDDEIKFTGCWFIPYYGQTRTLNGVFAMTDNNPFLNIDKLGAKDFEQISAGFTALAAELDPLIFDMFEITRRR